MTTTGKRVFESRTQTVSQPDDWTSAVSTATWCLQSVGVSVAEPTMRTLMVPELVTERAGLLDASGDQLARLLREHFGVRAASQSVISFDVAVARAGRQPVALGTQNWKSGDAHWVAVRRCEDGELILANPGGGSRKFGRTSLDRNEFERRGPFAAVWIELEAVEDRPAVGTPGAATVGDVPFNVHGKFRVVRTDGEGVLIRERPFLDGGRRGAVPEGSLVDGAEYAWRLVRTDNGLTGWVADAFLRPDGDRYRIVDTDGLGVRVREQPSPDGHWLGSAAEGRLVTGVETQAYRQIRWEIGPVGWATAAYLDRMEAHEEPRENLSDREESGQEAGGLGGTTAEWTSSLGAAIARENFWDPDGQPVRRAAMERFNRLPLTRRRAIFEAAMDAGLTAEGVTSSTDREHWKQAMRSVVVGDGFPGECPDLNPFMLAGEAGGVFRGGADCLNSSALGYFQFISQRPIPNGEGFSADHDYGHWRNSGPFPSDYGRQTDPACQVRQFIRAIRSSRKHHGDPLSVVREKASGDHTWGP